jgi:hypothetical protein
MIPVLSTRVEKAWRGHGEDMVMASHLSARSTFVFGHGRLLTRPSGRAASACAPRPSFSGQRLQQPETTKRGPQCFDIAGPGRVKELCTRVRRIHTHEVCGLHAKAFCQSEKRRNGRKTTACLNLAEVRFAQVAVPGRALLRDLGLSAQSADTCAKTAGEVSGARTERHPLTLGRFGPVIVQLE